MDQIRLKLKADDIVIKTNLGNQDSEANQNLK